MWQFMDQMNLVLRMADFMISAAVPYMSKQMSGHIINVGDASGHMPTAAFGAASAATRALQNYTESIALSLAGDNIKVTFVVAPTEITLATGTLMFAPARAEYKDSITEESRKIMESIGLFPDEPFSDCVNAIITIAGHKDPPHTLVAGSQAGAQLKERMNALSNDLSLSEDHIDD